MTACYPWGAFRRSLMKHCQLFSLVHLFWFLTFIHCDVCRRETLEVRLEQYWKLGGVWGRGEPQLHLHVVKIATSNFWPEPLNFSVVLVNQLKHLYFVETILILPNNKTKLRHTKTAQHGHQYQTPNCPWICKRGGLLQCHNRSYLTLNLFMTIIYVTLKYSFDDLFILFLKNTSR